MNLIKIKNICATKDTIKKVKRQPTEKEKIFVNRISDKGLISTTYKNFYSSKIKRQPNFQ